MNNSEVVTHLEVAQKIIECVNNDCEERGKNYDVLYETDLSVDWICVLNSDWFSCYLSDEMSWSIYRGVCYLDKKDMGWETWVICREFCKVDEIEKIIKKELDKEWM